MVLTSCHSWFLDNPDLDWSPPADLLDWMAKARADGKPIVYIGFGSITVPDPKRVTARIVEAVLQSELVLQNLSFNFHEHLCTQATSELLYPKGGPQG